MTRLPLTIWAFFITAVIGVVSFPVLLSAALLLIMDRSFGTSFFLSDIFIQGEVLHYQGGSPVLYEHLFWFLGHPEVYIVLLPALGITSEVIATNARKPIFGYRAMVASIIAIAFLSTIVWGHHMFISGMNPFLGSVFTFTTLLIGRTARRRSRRSFRKRRAARDWTARSCSGPWTPRIRARCVLAARSRSRWM